MWCLVIYKHISGWAGAADAAASAALSHYISTAAAGLKFAFFN